MSKNETNNAEFPAEDLPFLLSKKAIQRLKSLFYVRLHKEIQRQVNLTQSMCTAKELVEFCRGFRCEVVTLMDKQRLIVTTDWVVDNSVLNDQSAELKSRGKILPLAFPKEKRVLLLSVPRDFKSVWVHSNIANSSFVHKSLRAAFADLVKEQGNEILGNAFEQFAKKK